MGSTEPTPMTRYERYRQARDKRLDRRGGKHRAPQVNDTCERRFHAEEAGVSMARDAKVMDFDSVNPF